jgi:cyclopropane fatty-acyl-phospholipid synthase-like methyltransferase
MSWPHSYFDVLYSVSAVEHMQAGSLPAFFADCHRMLKMGGMMIHLIESILKTTRQPTPTRSPERAR